MTTLRKRVFIASLLACAVVFGTARGQAADPPPSWNDGTAGQSTGFLGGESAIAQSTEEPPPTPTAPAENHAWHFVAGLYGWFPGMSGTVTVRNFPAVPIDVPFSKVFDHLKMGLAGHFEGGRDKFGLGLDFMYVRLAVPVVRGPIPELVDASVNVREMIAEGFGYYRIAQGSGENPWKLELLGGVRFWDANTRLESNLPDAGGKTVDWADGFGGLRVEVPLGSKVSVVGRGDVGAGGAKLDWSASGDLAYRLGKSWILTAGYRSLHVNYDKSGVAGGEHRVFDVSTNGPRLFILHTW